MTDSGMNTAGRSGERSIRAFYSVIAVSGLCFAMYPQAVSAGKIEFYEDRSQGGDRIGTIPDARGPDREKTEYNLKKTNGWPNDEVQSLSLKWVTPGTRIELYDSPTASKKQDWVQIVVKRWERDIPIRHLETNKNKKKYDQVYYNQDGNLNGKVSHIKVLPAKPVNPPLEARLNLCLQETSEMRKKTGIAREDTNQGSRYRAYFPDFSVRSNGSFRARFKVNHIRNNANDDYAIIVMEFDPGRLLVSSSADGGFDNIVKGDESFSVTANEIWKSVDKDAKKNPKAMIVEVASKTAALLYDKGLAMSEKGGRQNFKYYIEDMMNIYGNAIVDCDEKKYGPPAANPEDHTDDVQPAKEAEWVATPTASKGKYQYSISFEKEVSSTASQRVVNKKTLVCSGKTCTWGSDDSTPSVKGCRKYFRGFGLNKVTAYGYRGRMLEKESIKKCNKWP